MRVAVFIDANTIDSRYIPVIYEEASGIGEIILKRAYGKLYEKEEYRDILSKYTIYIEETGLAYNDRVPAEMLVDMIKVAETGMAELLLVATLDEYIMPAVKEVRGKGVKTLLISDKNASASFVRDSGCFKYLEILNNEDEKCSGITSEADIAVEMKKIISYYKGMGTTVSAGTLYKNIIQKYPEFDPRNYGYTHFETFLRNSVSGIEFIDKNGTIYIKLQESREEIENFIYKYMAEKNNEIEDMQELFDALQSNFKDFSTSSYGYNSEYAFILSFAKLEIAGNKGVKMKQTFKLK
ncbi:MAG: OST-HTH/LOTUS domain-containing protein [Coprococcus sp.]